MALDLTALEQRRAALESRLASTTAALRDAQRRDDTRRKVVLGSALMAAVRNGSVSCHVVEILLGQMVERDRRLFVRQERTYKLEEQ